MADRVLVPLANGSTLALTVDAYREALALGAELNAAPAPPAAPSSQADLITADELATAAVKANLATDARCLRAVPWLHGLAYSLRMWSLKTASGVKSAGAR